MNIICYDPPISLYKLPENELGIDYIRIYDDSIELYNSFLIQDITIYKNKLFISRNNSIEHSREFDYSTDKIYDYTDKISNYKSRGLHLYKLPENTLEYQYILIEEKIALYNKYGFVINLGNVYGSLFYTLENYISNEIVP